MCIRDRRNIPHVILHQPANFIKIEPLAMELRRQIDFKYGGHGIKNLLPGSVLVMALVCKDKNYLRRHNINFNLCLWVAYLLVVFCFVAFHRIYMYVCVFLSSFSLLRLVWWIKIYNIADSASLLCDNQGRWRRLASGSTGRVSAMHRCSNVVQCN